MAGALLFNKLKASTNIRATFAGEYIPVCGRYDDMIIHSTTSPSLRLQLADGVANGLAPDGGLYVPSELPRFPKAYFRNIPDMSLKEIAFVVVNALFGDIIPADRLKQIVGDALDFEIPLLPLSPRCYALELFHGPTMSFNDIGARFMAQLLPIIDSEAPYGREIVIATAGDSGGAIAHAFRDMPDTRVWVLFPKGKVSREQLAVLAPLPNVRAMEVIGTLDECQQLAREALLAPQRLGMGRITSGNSVNLLRELPAIIQYFHAYARAVALHGPKIKMVISIPCGNLGSLCAAIMAKKMGLPVERLIAANNANDVFVEYLKTGGFKPQKALLTLARVMDVGNPFNLVRIVDLYGGSLDALRADVEGFSCSDSEIANTIKTMYASHRYIVNPQSATGLAALESRLKPDEIGVAMIGTHPAKSARVIHEILGVTPSPPASFPAAQPKITTIPPTLSALQRAMTRG